MEFIQYGSGPFAPAGWLNFDAAIGLRFPNLPLVGRPQIGARRYPAAVRYGDIVAGLPVQDGSAAAVYASHVLEHLALDDFHTALRNTYRMLKPGGRFRLIVPDLLERARRYVAAAEAGDTGAAPRFIANSYMGRAIRPRGPVKLLASVLGHSAHLWMWDEPSMRAALEQAGFAGTRRCVFGDSEETAFNAVERADRFIDGETGIVEIALECRRPD